ncbi:MAG: TauD/TfdA family dioxygenase [Litoreibacter sp.]|uniref:TauD/TfdA family dioxygenase n=1 Tax=Litoreibacter sp. TaxID=1969459 RepID=UPI003297464A
MARQIANLSTADSQTQKTALQILATDGIFTFSTAEREKWQDEFLAFANSLGDVCVQDDCDPSGIKTLPAEVACKGSILHTDRGSMERPPEIVLIFCETQSDQGGESIFLDGKALVDTLPAQVTSDLAAENSVCFGFPKYIRMTRILDETKDQRRFIRYRNDRWGFFAPSIRAHVDTIEDAFADLTETVRLPAGTGIAFRNDRYLHGALPSKAGDRIIHRLLVANTSLQYGFE